MASKFSINSVEILIYAPEFLDMPSFRKWNLSVAPAIQAGLSDSVLTVEGREAWQAPPWPGDYGEHHQHRVTWPFCTQDEAIRVFTSVQSSQNPPLSVWWWENIKQTQAEGQATKPDHHFKSAKVKWQTVPRGRRLGTGCLCTTNLDRALGRGKDTGRKPGKFW